MKRLWAALLALLCLTAGCAWAEEAETVIVLSDDAISVNGQEISGDSEADVYLAYQNETHEDVPEELKTLSNRVITIAEEGVYRFSGKASDVQIAVRAGEDDKVRLILDGIDISCRTAPAIVGHSAYDPRVPGEYGLTIELAEGSENFVTGSHTVKLHDDDAKFDGAVDSLVSLGFEGTGSLTIDADNEGVEVKFGHMTINGGVFYISSCDDPLNVSEDGVGTLTVNDGYLYSSVKPNEGGEGDGIDSNGYIVFNGGVAINLAHPGSQDGGIDSDMGSSINGGLIVGAGNMYDPIEADSEQLFMMLEFGQSTDDLVVVTDAAGKPVFAYDFPYDYMYIAFSTPELQEGVYHVYLGGEIEGEQQDGLYTSITSYTPGTLMQHGEGTAQQRNNNMMDGMQMGQAPEMPQGDMGNMQGMQNMSGMPDMNGQQPGGMDPMADMMNYDQAFGQLDLNELLKDADLNELLAGKDLNQLLTGFSVADLLSDEQIKELFGDIDPAMLDMFSGRGDMFGGFGGGMGGMRGLQSSADVATTDFMLTRGNTGFTNIIAAK